ncbi:MAG: S8 family serine peptidase, partial [Chloroflexi bacterium]|nr:S8 family serine peptidase [Chloroflexota bacterium]
MSRTNASRRIWPVLAFSRALILGAALLAPMAALGSQLASATSMGDPAVVPTVPYIVTFVAGTSSAAQAASLASAGAIDVDSIPVLRMHAAALPADSVDAVATALRADPTVLRVEADTSRAAEATPNDAGYATQWSLPQIGWDQAYGAVAPSGSSTVAILDTGIDASHPDLAGQVVSGTSILDGSNGLTDPNGHGTWMAGIVAAATDNGEGIAGVAYSGVQVMPVTVLGADGTGLDSDIIEGVVYAADHGANVILMAFSNPGYSASLQAAIDYAWSNGVVLVAATGNDGSSTPTYPAGDRGVVGVSATDSSDALWAGSNYGTDTFIAAPGVSIDSTDLAGGYTSVTGTSAAAAEVAAAAALAKAVDPSASNGVIVGRLGSSADAVGTADQTGNGRLNLARAISSTSTTSVVPVGAPGGGPFVGPYVAAAEAVSATWTQSTLTIAVSATGLVNNKTYQISYVPPSGTTFHSCFTNVGSASDSLILASGYVAGTWTVRLDAYNNNNLSCTNSGSGQSSRNGTTTGTVTVTAKQAQTITFAALGGKTYGDAPFTVSATASSGLPVTFSTSTTSVCTAGGANGATITIIAAGICTVNANQAGNASYNAAPQVQRIFTVAKATAVVVVTPYTNASTTYNGLPHAAAVTSMTGVNGETGATVGTVDVSNTTHTNAGTYATDSWSFTGTANYANIAATTITDSITKADAVISVTGYTGVYDGAAHGATGTATGVLSEDLSADLDLGTSFT